MNAVSLTSSFPATVQPGIPKLGETPTGWTRAPLGQYLKEVRRPIKMADDEIYKLVTVKRARGGVVDRGSFLGRDVLVKSQFEIEAGDFLISKRQIVHGACGLVPKKLAGSIVSNEYAVLNGSDGIDTTFLNYLAHSIFFQQTCFHSSIGVHVEKMIFKLDRWLKFDFNLPPLPEQRKIADILSTWDAAIEKTEALLATAKAQKRALMQSLLTGKRRFPGFEGQEWKEVRLGDVITDVKRPLQWSDDALYRLISVRRRSGGLFHREDLYGRDIKTKTLKNAQAGDFLISKMQVVHGAMGLVTDEFDEMQISGSYISVVAKDPNQLRIEFFDWLSRMPEMYHRAYLCSYGVHIEKMTFSFDLFLKEKIVIPPSAAEQDRIVEALNCAQNEERELVDAITKLRTEKKALMQQLLTGKRRVEL